MTTIAPLVALAPDVLRLIGLLALELALFQMVLDEIGPN